MTAMELLINKLMALGVAKEKLVAKVFGGAHVLPTGHTHSPLPDGNTDFALAYLAAERIPVVAKDVGGLVGRQVNFELATGSVYVRKLKESEASQIARKEAAYRPKVEDCASGLDLFGPSLNRRPKDRS